MCRQPTWKNCLGLCKSRQPHKKKTEPSKQPEAWTLWQLCPLTFDPDLSTARSLANFHSDCIISISPSHQSIIWQRPQCGQSDVKAVMVVIKSKFHHIICCLVNYTLPSTSKGTLGLAEERQMQGDGAAYRWAVGVCSAPSAVRLRKRKLFQFCLFFVLHVIDLFSRKVPDLVLLVM